MRKTVISLLLLLVATTLSAKSVVFTLNDTAGTRVYYKLSSDTPPTMVIGQDGTFQLNGTEYDFSNVKNFSYSKSDYSGEKNTVDGDALTGIDAPTISIDGDKVAMSGASGCIRVYTIDGRQVRVANAARSISLEGLPAGTYVISNGVSTLKLNKK